MSAKQYDLWIGGQWQPAVNGGTFDVLNPVDDSLFARCAEGSEEDVNRAVAAARQAFSDYSKTLPGEREAMLLRAADILQRDAQEFVDILVDEVGSPINKARFEVKYAVECLRASAGIPRRTKGETIPTDMPGRMSMSVRAPVGVVATITPFNVPLIKGVKLTASPLAFGNCVVVQPSFEAPSVLLRLAKVYEEAGFPAGAYNVVSGFGHDIGDSLTAHQDVRTVLFTGSLRVGRHIAEICGKQMKHCVLELGGKSPLVVMADADIEAAVHAAVMGCFFFQGQGCMVASRILVERPVLEAFTAKLQAEAERLSRQGMGDLRESTTLVGPIIHDRQREKIRSHVEGAREKGARVIGGDWVGNRIQPTILQGVTEEMDVCREETFGPVTSIYPIDTLDEAVEVANDTNYGLSAAIFTKNIDVGLSFANRVESGMVHINAPTFADEPHIPFGGTKDSGFGREGTEIDADILTEWKWITIQLPAAEAQVGPSA